MNHFFRFLLSLCSTDVLFSLQRSKSGSSSSAFLHFVTVMAAALFKKGTSEESQDDEWLCSLAEFPWSWRFQGEYSASGAELSSQRRKTWNPAPPILPKSLQNLCRFIFSSSAPQSFIFLVFHQDKLSLSSPKHCKSSSFYVEMLLKQLMLKQKEFTWLAAFIKKKRERVKKEFCHLELQEKLWK